MAASLFQYFRRKRILAKAAQPGSGGLIGADLRGSNLNAANLSLAYLSEANLENANLSEAHLDGADLRGAKYNSETMWPEGFDPVAAGALLRD